MNKFRRMSGGREGGEPRGHGLAEAVHLAPDTLSAPCHPVGDPVSVTLMTTQATICTYLYDVTISVLD